MNLDEARMQARKFLDEILLKIIADVNSVEAAGHLVYPQ